MSNAPQSQVAVAGRAPLLGDVCGGRDNNLNLIRMIAASAVLVSHSFLLTLGFGAVEPLEPLTGHSLGWLSVTIFFVVSGFLITRSFDRRASIGHWVLARVLRLYPGLLVMLALTVLVLGPLVTAVPLRDYWSAPETWTYLPRNASLAKLQYPLPGVFGANPYYDAINRSLWTLVYEVICYGGVFVAGILGTLRRPRWFVAWLIGFAILYVAVLKSQLGLSPSSRIASTMSLALPFTLGMAAYVWRDRVRLDWRIAAALWAAATAAWFTPLFTEAYVLAVSYTVLTLAYRPKGALLHYNQIGDYSYGIYIYAMPIQQLMVYLFPGQNWAVNTIMSFPTALILAILSWHFVEKRVLALIKPGAERWSSFWKREGLGTLP